MAHSIIFNHELHSYYQKRALAKHGADKAQNRGTTDPFFLLDYIKAELSERFALICRNFTYGVDYFGYDGRLGAQLLASGKVAKMAQMHDEAAFANSNLAFYRALREDLPEQFFKDNKIDLFLCPLNLHFINDLPQFLHKLRQLLAPDGLFFAVIPAGSSFYELRASLIYAEEKLYKRVSPRIAPFISIDDLGYLLAQAGFALPVIDKQDITLNYRDIYHLMADLKVMGMQNILYQRSKEPVGARFFALANDYYKEHFTACRAKIKASLSLLWLSAWSPAANQPPALKPGTAQISLKDYFAKGRRSLPLKGR